MAKANKRFVFVVPSFLSQVHAQYAKIRPWTCFGLRIIDLKQSIIDKIRIFVKSYDHDGLVRISKMLLSPS